MVDENLGVPDYTAMPRPDLVGITAFTSQAGRAYRVAAEFRTSGVPVVMGGIHATMRPAEASERVDAVVTGEAESIWVQVLEDAKLGALKRVYTGTRMEMDKVPLARHDLLPDRLSLWVYPDHARLPAQLQLLQRHYLQRKGIPAPPD